MDVHDFRFDPDDDPPDDTRPGEPRWGWPFVLGMFVFIVIGLSFMLCSFFGLWPYASMNGLHRLDLALLGCPTPGALPVSADRGSIVSCAIGGGWGG